MTKGHCGQRYGPCNTQMTWCNYVRRRDVENKGSKYGSCGELFFLAAERAVRKVWEDFVSTPFDVSRFMRRFRRDALTWEPQAITLQSGSSEGLANHVFSVRKSSAVP